MAPLEQLLGGHELAEQILVLLTPAQLARLRLVSGSLRAAFDALPEALWQASAFDQHTGRHVALAADLTKVLCRLPPSKSAQPSTWSCELQVCAPGTSRSTGCTPI